MSNEYDETKIQLFESTTGEPFLRIAARNQSADQVNTWTWKKFFEIGLSCAGITLWKWNINTGHLSSFFDSSQITPLCPFSLPTTWEEIVHPEDRDRLREALDRFEQTSYTSFDCVFRLGGDEARQWVHARDMHLFTNAKGEPDDVIGLFIDVTESELAKEQMFWGRDVLEKDDEDKIRLLRIISERRRHLRDSKKISSLMDQCYQEFMSLFSFSGLPAFRKNTDLAYVEVNPAMEQLLSIPSKDILNRTDEEIWGKDVAERLRSLCLRVLQGETILEERPRIIHGERILLLDQLYPDWSSDGHIIGVCGIMTPKPTDQTLNPRAPSKKERASVFNEGRLFKTPISCPVRL